MTTSRTPFVRFRSACAPLLAALTAAVTASAGIAGTEPSPGPSAAPGLQTVHPPRTADGNPGAQTSPPSRIVRLPASAPAPGAWPPPALKGSHLHWRLDDIETYETTLGPILPRRALVAIVERRADEIGGRGSGISVESLGSALLLRGGSAGEEGTLEAIRRAALDAVGDMESVALAASFQTRVRLLAGSGTIPSDASAAGASDVVTVIDDVRRIASGERAGFGALITRAFLADFDVEVATGISIADPSVAVALSGETVHLWAATELGADGVRRLYVQGLVDITHDGPPTSFDPDVYELGAVEQPHLSCTQVFFAGTVPSDGPLVVELEGIDAPLTSRRLEITAANAARPNAQAESRRTVPPSRLLDFARGMWRTGLGSAHRLTGERLPFSLADARTPATAAQLLGLVFGRTAEGRPDLGSTLAILPASGAASYARVQALFREIDPVGSNRTLTVSDGAGFQARFPATRGALLRVARTQESVLITDYDPQISTESALVDPRAEFSLTGTVLEAVLEEDPGALETASGSPGLRLSGSVSSTLLLQVNVREADPMDTGRIQHPVLRSTSAPIDLRAFGETTAAGWTVRLRR